jgi:UDP-N-acetylmuramyl pentapeptide phosphotransferase/UDP-N-acetylglucosamine-1-phosphate transferase
MQVEILYFFIFSFLSFIFFKFYLNFSINKKIIDKNTFNVGNKKTPTGSGIVFLIIFFLGSFFYFILDNAFPQVLPNKFYILYFSVAIFGLLSFYDDIRPLDPILRLVIQFLVIFFSTVCLDLSAVNLPLKLSMFIAILFWIYIINISNFIDGLDGFFASQAFFFLLGIIFIKINLNINIFSYYISLILLPVIIIFFLFNKPYAKLYMGDSGSIVLGYLFGFSILELIILKQYLIAISIYAYPILDCSVTLVKKVLNGHYPWARLFDYFFLAPVIKGKNSHAFVLRISIFFNIVNFLLIILQLKLNSLFFILNIACAAVELYIFNRFSKSRYS